MAETVGRKWTLVNEGTVEEFAVMHLADRMGLPRIEPDGSGGWRTVTRLGWLRSKERVEIPAPEIDAAALGTAVAGGRWLAGKLLKEIRKDIGSGVHEGDGWGCVREGVPVVEYDDWGREEYVRHLPGLNDVERERAAEEIAKGREVYGFGYQLGDDSHTMHRAYAIVGSMTQRVHDLGPGIYLADVRMWHTQGISDGVSRRLAERDGVPPQELTDHWKAIVDMAAAELPTREGETQESRTARLSALGLSGRKPKESLDEELKTSKSTLADLAVKAAGWRTARVYERGVGQTVPVGDPIPDGRRWFRLTGPEALDYESDRMAHCVGEGYFDTDVADGNARIYSLRREREGAMPKPNVTVRVSFLDEGTKSVSGDDLGRVDVVQVEEIKGFANSLPAIPGKKGDGQDMDATKLDKEAMAAVAVLVNAEFPAKQVRWREPAIRGSGTEYVLDEGGRWTLFRGLGDPLTAGLGKLRVEAGIVATGGRVWLPRETVTAGMRVEGAAVASLPESILVEGPQGNLASGKFGDTDAAFVGCTLDGRDSGTFLAGRRKDGSMHVVDVTSPEGKDAYAGVLCWFDSDDGRTGLGDTLSSRGTKVILKAPEVWLPMLRTAGEVKVEGKLMSLPNAIACGTLDLSDAAGPDGKPYPLHELLGWKTPQGLLLRTNFHVDYVRWGGGPGQEVCVSDLQMWSLGIVANGAEFKEAMEFVSAMSVRDPQLAALVGKGLEKAMAEKRLNFNPSASDAKAMVRFCRIASALCDTAPRIARKLAVAVRESLEAMPEQEREEWSKRNPCSAKVVATVGRRTVIERAVVAVANQVRGGVSKAAGWAAVGAKASKAAGMRKGPSGMGFGS